MAADHQLDGDPLVVKSQLRVEVTAGRPSEAIRVGEEWPADRGYQPWVVTVLQTHTGIWKATVIGQAVIKTAGPA